MREVAVLDLRGRSANKHSSVSSFVDNQRENERERKDENASNSPSQ